MFERPHHQRIEQALCGLVNGAGMAARMTHAMTVQRFARVICL
jgi:hypothetical protein